MGACHEQLWVHGMDTCGCMSWTTVGACHGQLWVHGMGNCGCMAWATVGAWHGQLWVHGMGHCVCMAWATVGAWHGQLWVHGMGNCGCMAWATVGAWHGQLWVHVIKVLIMISNRDPCGGSVLLYVAAASSMWELLLAITTAVVKKWVWCLHAACPEYILALLPLPL